MLGGFSASVRYAPAVRYIEVEVYVEHMLFEKFVQDLELKPVTSPVQTVLDLLGHAGRGEEAADAVIAKVYEECCYTERIQP